MTGHLYRIGVTAAYDNYRDRTDASALIQRLTPAGNRRTFVLLLASPSWGRLVSKPNYYPKLFRNVLSDAYAEACAFLEVPLWLHSYEGLQQQLQCSYVAV